MGRHFIRISKDDRERMKNVRGIDWESDTYTDITFSLVGTWKLRPSPLTAIDWGKEKGTQIPISATAYHRLVELQDEMGVNAIGDVVTILIRNQIRQRRR